MNERTTPSRSQLRAHREVFWDAWQKHLAGLPLNALEVRISRVVVLHPEYHQMFDDREDFLDRDFGVDDGANPYLHLSLHLALEEQIATRQPPEAAQALEFLMQGKGVGRHDALHVLLEKLAENRLPGPNVKAASLMLKAYSLCLKGLMLTGPGAS